MRVDDKENLTVVPITRSQKKVESSLSLGLPQNDRVRIPALGCALLVKRVGSCWESMRTKLMVPKQVWL